MIRIIFGSSKIVPGFLINFFGLQVFRLLVSSFLINISRKISSYRKREISFVKKLESTGFLIKPFLSNSELKIIKEICDQEMKYSRVIKRGKTNELICDNKDLLKRQSRLLNVLENVGIVDFFESLEGLKLDIKSLNVSIEKTKFGVLEDYDIFRQWHVDTFASHYKAWIPLEDINEDNFPMKYLPKSHLITFERLFEEWIWSFTFKKGDYNINGIFNQSRRSHTNKKNLYDQKCINLKAKAGNLIITDNSGLHRRGEGKTGSERYWLRFGFRRSPFIPKFN